MGPDVYGLLYSSLEPLGFAIQDLDSQVAESEELRSYDVSALFTSVPVDKAVEVIRRKLEKDNTLKSRTNLLNFCLSCTYFVWDDEFYKQIHGAAMGSPVSPPVCNGYMEEV